MFLTFFTALKAAGVPVSMREYLDLMGAMEADLPARQVEGFYHLARTVLVKDEKNLDRFDRVFASVFKGLESTGDAVTPEALPEDWLRRMAERYLTDEEKRQIEALGGFETLMETLKQRLAEQKGRHQGGSKWIGTAGTSPFGAYGYNPEGVRIGQDESRHRRAVKVWDKREFRDLDDRVEIGTRQIRVALKRLRRFARTGVPEELDLSSTIDATARQGWLDVKLRPERRNTVRVVLFLDVGGSMDDHVRVTSELFSAARSEFKSLHHYYFHNCLYEGVWQANARRHGERVPTVDLLRTFPADTRVVIVGDASMSPYEITHPGGSVEHWNEEAGAVWLQRVVATWPKLAWINPVPEDAWSWTHSIGLVRELIGDRMVPLTLEGLDRAMRALGR
ncbi:vWA domain-containing protein [Chthonobacter rhizosphaerae]|uniref:vWA domain-containing protein n=1 Tax=Chthonobacter rhizosphaerae TaxID=2735553 RepID=UPI0015EEFA4A|nr:VWA domain-containing protein [Chthonobacter rhizosphaerae]